MLQRGFKTWCENTAKTYRKELGITLKDPLPPYSLADHLNIKVVLPEDVPEVRDATVRQLTQVDSSSWSAITMSRDAKTVIIMNSAHAPMRMNSNIVHEISHIILGHEPVEMIPGPDGYHVVSHFDRTQEYEADWLTGVLLLPRDGLLAHRRRGATPERIAQHYGISMDMYQWRSRMSGVEIQMKRSRARRGSCPIVGGNSFSA